MMEQVEFETSIPGNSSAGSALQERIVKEMEQFSYSMRDVFAIRLSFEEGFTNAVRHGNKLDESKSVYVSCRINESRLQIQIRDEGEGFNPDAVPDPTNEVFIERPTGRGLLLIRTYMSHCEYCDNGRSLIMVRERNSPLPILDD